jgi:hypothetical protein
MDARRHREHHVGRRHHEPDRPDPPHSHRRQQRRLRGRLPGRHHRGLPLPEQHLYEPRNRRDRLARVEPRPHGALRWNIKHQTICWTSVLHDEHLESVLRKLRRKHDRARAERPGLYLLPAALRRWGELRQLRQLHPGTNAKCPGLHLLPSAVRRRLPVTSCGGPYRAVNCSVARRACGSVCCAWLPSRSAPDPAAVTRVAARGGDTL